MKKTLSQDILKLFNDKSSNLSLKQIYEEVKTQFPDKDPIKLKHSIRRSIQSLYAKNSISRIGQGKYSLVS